LSQSLVDLLQELVRIGSRAGEDSYQPILDHLSMWLTEAGVESRPVNDPDIGLVGLVSEVRGAQSGPTLVLDATLDTAPFGDLDSWTAEPLSGLIRDGWLYGRGAADSKAAASIFSHIAAALAADTEHLAGRLFVIYECDEHTGNFGAAREFYGRRMRGQRIDGVMLGYPGMDRIVVGGRGFERFVVTVRGDPGHSGSSTPAHSNALVKAAQFIMEIGRLDEDLHVEVDSDLGLPPRLTATHVSGGEGFSTVPDKCVIHVDARLTSTFSASQALHVIQETITSIDQADPERPSTLEQRPGWPPFHTAADTPFVAALQLAAKRVLGQEPPLEVVGPSNVGNYLANLGIPATAGFGTRYQNIHGVDEAIEVATLEPVYRVYSEALGSLLTGSDH
jgi:succinyl-diaminopimelate desuccinylase